MFNLNPLHLPDATLHHLIMLLVACTLGFIIGYVNRKNHIRQLEQKLHSVAIDLQECRQFGH